MGLGVKEGLVGGFSKVVWENQIDTLAGGLSLDLTGLNIADYPGGIIPEGTPVARNLDTQVGKIIGVAGDPADLNIPAGFSAVGYTNHDAKFENNCLVGVGTFGSIRIKAVPAFVKDNADLFLAAIPNVKHV